MPYTLVEDRNSLKLVDKDDNVLYVVPKKFSEQINKTLMYMNKLEKETGFWDNPRVFINKLLNDKHRYEDGIFLKYLYDKCICRVYKPEEQSVEVKNHQEWYSYSHRLRQIINIEKVYEYVSGKHYEINMYGKDTPMYYYTIHSLIGKKISLYEKEGNVFIHLSKGNSVYAFEPPEGSSVNLLHTENYLKDLILFDIHTSQTCIEFKKLCNYICLCSLITDKGVIILKNQVQQTYVSSFQHTLDNIRIQ